MPPKTVFWTSIVSFSILFCAASLAQLASISTQKKILVLAKEGEAEPMQALTEIMSSHFRDLNATLVLETISLPERDVVGQVEAVRASALRQNAFSAIWVERSSEEIFLFVSDKSTQKVFVQTFEGGTQEGWEAECETIAALVRSALITWLEIIPETPPPAPPPAPEPKVAPPAPAPEPAKKSVVVSAEVRTPPQKTKPTSARIPVTGRFTLGFAGKMIYSDQPWTYNVALDIGLLLWKTVTVAVGSQLGSPSDLNVPDRDVVLRNYPIYLKLGYFHDFGKLALEAGGASVSDITYMDERSGIGKVDKSRRFEAGVGLYLRLEYRTLPFLSIFGSIGADFFFKTTRYNWYGETVFKFGPAQPYLLVGITFSTVRP